MSPEIPRILVVEDEPGIRQGIFRILTGRGLQAATAPGGEQALEMLQAEAYPIVLVDLKMPGMDGFELIERINKLKPGTICVVVSALATVPTIVKTTKMGTFDFVVKPFVPDDLMVVVNHAIEKWHSAEETQRLRAEREAHLLQLTTEKSRLKTIVQSIGDGLLVVNIDKNVVLDNAAARAILRRVGEPTQCVPVCELIPDPKVCEEIGKLLSNPEDRQVKLEMALPAWSAKENPVYVKVTVAPFRDESGHVLGVVVLMSDVSETKAYERMKTMFISMVAHEIKAPIAAIESYLNIIEGGVLDKDIARIKEIAARCLDRSGSLLSLVQDLLEITRRDSLQAPNRVIEKLDLVALTGQLVDFHRSQAADRRIGIEICAPPALPFPADSGEMERVLTNLISNAIKYNREGGRIWVRLASTASIARIEIEDTGLGMKPEEIERVGEEFFRIKNQKTRNITGTGLGLALVKRIVKSYHGVLQIESRADEGSIFRVLLPFNGNRGMIDAAERREPALV